MIIIYDWVPPCQAGALPRPHFLLGEGFNEAAREQRDLHLRVDHISVASRRLQAGKGETEKRLSRESER